MLVEFWDFARVNSLRTLPYLAAWHERYAGHGLSVIGVHCPGYSFGADSDLVNAAVRRLEIPYPVLLDPGFEVWRRYGNRGWPARYLFDSGGLLRDVHYGEGDYREGELAVQEILLEVDEGFTPPPPMDPLRPEDAPDALLEPQTADIALPGDRGRVELIRDWSDGRDYIEAEDAGAGATASFTGGGAFAVLSGAVTAGVYETGASVIAESPGLRLHGFQFTPAPPSAA